MITSRGWVPNHVCACARARDGAGFDQTTSRPATRPITSAQTGRSARRHPIETEERMRRLNFLEDEPWDEVNDDLRMRRRWFGHPLGTDMLGASLTELLPGSPEDHLHMHYGLREEMFFVLSGTPTVHTPDGEERLSPGEVIYFPKARPRLHTFLSIRRTSPVRWSASRPSDCMTAGLPTAGRSPGWLRVIQTAERGRR